ncbi:TetR/AcrR family transcriptional regulator [Streptomyces endophytica]|uniref:TetR/AcrR family transcriptional regulator n=1 Tax=Streptomyces endophytica TaxID=2991496 RepID=A0ABY6P870_9ACTN|nr:TetR/AcrR family transcriptional regulator [Streptomyces endophytica]UZJ29793.1 TetR/AcrR family transcriptional regulator [Streptomyces endophytica]
MARPRQFDEDRALDAAMEAFWITGYEATSTQDLCDATGLGRSSIYNTFKSKHDLFERALARYMERKNAEMHALLESELPAREKVRALFQRTIDDECAAGADGRGCLVVNTCIEVSAHDPSVAAALERDYGARLAAVRAMIESGQRAGDITARTDAGTLAHLLIATIGGLRVSARAGLGRAALEGVADAAMGGF